jgi:proteic killer suppression protein
MEVRFEKKELEELYNKGKTKNKKYHFDDKLIVKYIKVIDMIKLLERIEDFYKYTSLSFHSLSGNKNGLYAVSVDFRYRIQFRIGKNENNEIVITIVEFSNYHK